MRVPDSLHLHRFAAGIMALRTLTISTRVVGTTTIVDLDGAIDIMNSPGLRTTLFSKAETSSRLAVNMKGIRYIDSSGIATLIEALKKTQVLKKEFVLFALGPAVHDVLKMTNLLGVFQIADTEENALRQND
jgi:anti-sigma B factor antagonist